MKFAHRNFLMALGVVVALGACGGGGSDAPSMQRTTAYGPIVGTNDAALSGTYFWKGVPFAQAPVGALRWRAPAEPTAWSAPLATDKFGNACIQNGRIYGPGSNNTYDSTIATTLNTPVGSEDCLTLNVWRPATKADGLPVIVFVYGGSNISGYTADPVYDGAALAKAAQAVVVTTNYRVGPLGFFNMAQLKGGTDAAEDSGNFALLDIIQALKFVKANVAAFGGDAGNVTLMGQSAGAINVWALLASPLASGLFHKAVPLSGGISLASNLPPGTIPTLNPPAASANQANGLVARLLIADGLAADMAAAQTLVAGMSSAEVAAYMRAKDAQVILSTLLANGLTGSGPIPDGTVVPANPISAIEAGNYNKVPVLAGMTAEEGKLFAPFLTLFGGPPGFLITDAARFNLMAGYDPDAPPAVAIGDIIDAAYLPADTPSTGWNARTALITAGLFGASRDNVLNALKTQQPNVWYYQFNWAQQPAPWDTIYGAAHAFDLPFVFGNFGPSLFSNVVNSAANQPGRLALSAAMMASIAAFAKNGDPNHAGLGVTWQPWPGKLLFDATATQAVITTQ
ncbi:acetylcholinesterase [Burkholderiaceae bacterium]|nr:acetylcholinesterase [Burkholderiaceae bacterium]